ncbi:MAG: ATP phosphoribosyltransferase, partial [Verrucomicrobiota bacterium]
VAAVQRPLHCAAWGLQPLHFRRRRPSIQQSFTYPPANLIWGATEVKVPELADAIVDITETGSSIKANKLRIVAQLLETTTVLVANKAAWADPVKRAKIEQIVLMLQGALAAQHMVGLKFNLPKARLEAVAGKLPALRNPTVSQLSNPEWIAVETIIDARQAREFIPTLKAAGAEGIVEYPINKLVY